VNSVEIVDGKVHDIVGLPDEKFFLSVPLVSIVFRGVEWRESGFGTAMASCMHL